MKQFLCLLAAFWLSADLTACASDEDAFHYLGILGKAVMKNNEHGFKKQPKKRPLTTGLTSTSQTEAV